MGLAKKPISFSNSKRLRYRQYIILYILLQFQRPSRVSYKEGKS